MAGEYYRRWRAAQATSARAAKGLAVLRDICMAAGLAKGARVAGKLLADALAQAGGDDERKGGE